MVKCLLAIMLTFSACGAKPVSPFYTIRTNTATISSVGNDVSVSYICPDSDDRLDVEFTNPQQKNSTLGNVAWNLALDLLGLIDVFNGGISSND